MTISCEKTGNLFLHSKEFEVRNEKYGLIKFDVIGYTQGLGGNVKVTTGMTEKIIHVGPCSKANIFGQEFWGEYSDHPKRQKTTISLVYP